MTPKLKKCGVSSSSWKNCHEFGVKKNQTRLRASNTSQARHQQADGHQQPHRARALPQVGCAAVGHVALARVIGDFSSGLGDQSGWFGWFFCWENGGANTIKYPKFLSSLRSFLEISSTTLGSFSWIVQPISNLHKNTKGHWCTLMATGSIHPAPSCKGTHPSANTQGQNGFLVKPFKIPQLILIFPMIHESWTKPPSPRDPGIG